MNREDHNAFWGVERGPRDPVNCHLIGWGEISQYDPKCGYCVLGHTHTWAQHDQEIEEWEAGQAAKSEAGS